MPAKATLEQTEKLACTQILDYAKPFFKTLKPTSLSNMFKSKEERSKATIKVEAHL